MLKSIIAIVLKSQIAMAATTVIGLSVLGGGIATVYNKQTIADQKTISTTNSSPAPNSSANTATTSTQNTSNTPSSSTESSAVANGSTTSQTSASSPTTSKTSAIAPSTTASSTTSNNPKTINASAIALKDKSSGYCKALAPNDWAFTSNSLATGADLFSTGKTMHAGWGISAVPAYMYPTIDSFLNTWMPLAGYSGFSMGASSNLEYDFVKCNFTSTIGKKGVVIYKVYNFGSADYIVSVYIAATDNNIWESDGAQAFYSAISIRCVSQLRPSTSSINYSGSNASSKSDNPEVDLSNKWTEAIMGYDNVYSPTTGEHYEAPVNSYWETGPSGEGYYREVPGGGSEKLSRGFGDY